MTARVWLDRSEAWIRANVAPAAVGPSGVKYEPQWVGGLDKYEAIDRLAAEFEKVYEEAWRDCEKEQAPRGLTWKEATE